MKNFYQLQPSFTWHSSTLFDKARLQEEGLREEERVSGGRVRRLLLERRAGWDRSYPLEPLTRQSPELLFKKLPNLGGSPMKSAKMERPRIINTKAPLKISPTSRIPKKEPDLARNIASLSVKEETPVQKEGLAKPGAGRGKSALRRPLSTKQELPSPSRHSPSKPITPRISTPPQVAGLERKDQQTNKAEELKVIKEAPIKAPPKVDHKPADSNVVNCKICGRYFNPDRIQLHESICKKTTTKKRKPFDPVKHRLEGTEAESYMGKRKHGVRQQQQQIKMPPKSNWRKKHEEFIANIRAAKEAQAHIAKGGKLSDLPPPPPLDTSDYIQCPHCTRRFNQNAAERHIPKCANIINKPKPTTRKSTQRK